MKLSLLRYALPFLALGLVPTFAVEVTDKPMTTGFRAGRNPANPIDTIVIHFSSDVRAHPGSPYGLDAVIGTWGGKASAHYLIDRSGKIYRLVKESDTAWHAGAGTWMGRTNNLNDFSIGIELMAIGTCAELKRIIEGWTDADCAKISPKDIGYTEAQYTALKALIADIEQRHPAITHDRKHIIGHDEYAPGRKVDPGSLFDWSKIGM